MNVIRRGPVMLAYNGWGDAATGPEVVLLHGLAGWSGEWAPTVEWLSATHQVVALDQRGHGHSTRRPDDVSRAAYVKDVIALIETLHTGPVVLVGHSLGGHTAMLLAAQRPDLVDRLVVVEATPERDAEAPERVRRWLSSWPIPFRSRSSAVDFFDTLGYFRSALAAKTWAAGLDERRDGLWSRFDIDVMVEALREVAANDYWDQWRAIRCPTLVVRGEHGSVSSEQADQMLERLSGTDLIEIADAGHDVHLDQPNRWCNAMTSFLRNTPGSTTSFNR